jgi:hypothetical protein
MAMMADNVPAVQALGQCVFLPMLIIGGIAVPLGSLPDWAQHLSAFFPGRYAVQALQACVNGAGAGSARFDLLALTIIGAAGCIGGGMMFRWDAQQRFAARRGKGWVLVPLAAWATVGILSEVRNRVATPPQQAAARTTTRPTTPAPASTPSQPAQQATPRPAEAPASPAEPPTRRESAPPPQPASPAKPSQHVDKPEVRVSDQPDARRVPSAADRTSTSETPPRPAAPPIHQPIAATWQGVTLADIDRDLIFDRLPSDAGVVAPIAPADEEPPPEVVQQLDGIRVALPKWAPAKVPDVVQRARNILYIAAVPDVLQTELERFAPYVVFDQLEHDIPKDDLMKALYWIALHPMDGDDTAIDQLPALGFENRAVGVEQTRERTALYAVKLLGRLTGAIRGG